MIKKDLVMSRYRNPQYKKKPIHYCQKLDGINKSCGDSLEMFLDIIDSKVSLSYEGDGCSIAIYTADMLCQILNGKDMASVKNIILELQNVIDLDIKIDDVMEKNYDDFVFLREYPNRINCCKLSINLAQTMVAKC